jgi:hypothetical protein
MRLDYPQIAQAMDDLRSAGILSRWRARRQGRLTQQAVWRGESTHRMGLLALASLPQTLNAMGEQLVDFKRTRRWHSPVLAPSEETLDLYEKMDALIAQPRRQAVRDQNQALVERWCADGWLQGSFQVQATSPSRSEHHGLVKIGSLAHRQHHMMLNIRPSGDLPRLSLSLAQALQRSTPVFQQWLTVAHEAAHTEMVDFSHPFQPSTSALQKLGVSPEEAPERVAHWNRTLFSLGALGPFFRQFEEAFADTYGAMMVLRATQFDPHAWVEVNRRRLEREHARQKVVQEDSKGTWKSKWSFDDYEITAPALKRLMETRDSWATLSPQACRAHALEIVSDAWLNVAALHCQQEPDWASKMDWSTLDKAPTLYRQLLAAFTEEPTAVNALLDHHRPLLEGTVGHLLSTKWGGMWQRAHPDGAPPLSAEDALADPARQRDARLEAAHEFLGRWWERWQITHKGREACKVWKETLENLSQAVAVGYAPTTPAVTAQSNASRRRQP